MGTAHTAGLRHRTEYEPGRVTLKSYTTGGYTTGSFYPSVVVRAYDGSSYQEIWKGVGVGVSENPDFRVSSQLVLDKLVSEQFPQCSSTSVAWNAVDAELGLKLKVFTVDGNDYYAMVMNVEPYSRAARAGLRRHDMILEVSGVSVQNTCVSDIYRFLELMRGGEVLMKVTRSGVEVPVRISRTTK